MFVVCFSSRQISSSQWKKFIEAGRLPSSERFQTDLWKGEGRERSRSQHQEQPSSPKRSEYKKLNTNEPGKRVKVYTESESLGNGRPVKGVPASFGYVKKSSEMKRHDANAGGGKVLAYKTANVTSVPKLMEDQPVSLDRSLERTPKTRLKVSGGTQTDLGGASRTIRPSQSRPSASSPPASATSGHQPNGSYSDSDYQSPSGMKFPLSRNPANPAGVPAAAATPTAAVLDSSSATPATSAMPGPTGTTSPAGRSNGSGQQLTFKSYSLTAPIANQLSHNVRERLMLSNGTQSLPKTHFNQLKGTVRLLALCRCSK